MKEFLIGRGGFASFEAAFAAAEKNSTPGEEIVFRLAGEILLQKPVRVTRSPLFDGRTVTFRGTEGTTVSGGTRVSGFTPYRDNIFRAAVPDVDYARTLWLDGKFAPRPATEKIAASAWSHAQGDCDFYEENGTVTGLVTTRREILSYRNIRDVDMIFNVGWTHHVIPIESVRELDDGRVFIRPLAVPFETSRQAHGVHIGGCPTCFENVFERLENPGEWYFDREEKALYLCFAPGDTPENHTVELPACEALFEIEGRADDKIGHLRFENITFQNTTFLRPSRYGHSDLQAGFPREGSDADMPERAKPHDLDNLKLPGAVRVIAGQDILFRYCRFTQLDSTALSFEFGTQDCTVQNCEFYDLGAGALMLGDVVSDRSHHPSDPRETVRGIRIEDCFIRDTGKDFFSTVAVLLGYVYDCHVCHNEIRDVPYSAVSVGWGWGHSDPSVGPHLETPWTTPAVTGKNEVSFNRVDRCMMTLYDGGAVYTLGAMDGTVIEGNYVTRAGGYEGDGYDGLAVDDNVDHRYPSDWRAFMDRGPFPGGIYLDEGSRGIDVHDNVVWGATVPLFYHNTINGGVDRVVFRDNRVNLRPGEPGFPEAIAARAGRRK